MPNNSSRGNFFSNPGIESTETHFLRPVLERSLWRAVAVEKDFLEQKPEKRILAGGVTMQGPVFEVRLRG